MKSIVSFGECMVELRTDKNGQIQQGFAGDVYNTCVYLKRLFPTLSVEFATQVGHDVLSQNMLSRFAAENIGCQFITHSVTKAPGLYWINTDEEGERTFTYWRNDSAARSFIAAIDETLVSGLKQSDWLFISGISLAVIQPELRDMFWQLVNRLKDGGVKVIFDPNYRPKLWNSTDETKLQYAKAFEMSDMVLPGVEDLESLYQLDTIPDIIRFLAPFNIDEIVIKNGPEKVYTISQGKLCKVAIIPVDNVVDTTSAGDSFNGAYIGNRLNGIAIKQSVLMAAKVAGFVIQHPGAIVERDTFNLFKASLEANDTTHPT
ncbi:sugar kinase [Psychrosphaera sp. B3R10]|uniref:sugar kinase n=1 Tax=unclassified Psychrosphaera TaxID=2641570 RepID=UPI001C095B26|nr:sugar kinase [Psychrosphaera sp. 1_MG-2023]MBU2881036.1 sugar kinase [Psychrosphaera sp. I2R16]MBU2989960.1 sugar kinase [Psychrosphaera sp. B3R10]MDO6719149.1 sugar kinase [Psychrosphaera sp. 1_MG-2023]